MFQAYEHFWKDKSDLRFRLESRIRQILSDAGDPQSSKDLYEKMRPTEKGIAELDKALLAYKKPSGFKQPQAHIGALCAEMVRNQYIQRSIRKIGGKRLVVFK